MGLSLNQSRESLFLNIGRIFAILQSFGKSPVPNERFTINDIGTEAQK